MLRAAAVLQTRASLSLSDNGAVVPGWVTLAEEEGSDEQWTAEIKTGTRYLTATCYVLDALEHGGTSGEKGFALFAEM